MLINGTVCQVYRMPARHPKELAIHIINDEYVLVESVEKPGEFLHVDGTFGRPTQESFADAWQCACSMNRRHQEQLRRKNDFLERFSRSKV